MTAGQPGECLHTMAILQAYQANLLKDLDESERVDPEAVRELHQATDLSLQTHQGDGHKYRPVYGSPGTAELTTQYIRDQSLETGSLSRLSGSMETSAKCISVNPANYRKSLQNPVWFLSTLIEQDSAHSDRPW